MFQNFIGVDLWTALAILINTLLIVYVGKRKLFEPVKKMIDSRQQEIDEMYSQADAAKETAKQLQAEYEEKLAAAAETSEQIVKEAVARGQTRHSVPSRSVCIVPTTHVLWEVSLITRSLFATSHRCD